MTEPAQDFGDGFDLLPCGNRRTADHHHRQREFARGLDLGRSRIAPAFRATMMSARNFVRMARSAAASNGPRATITSAFRSGSAARGGSTSRTR